MTTDGAAALGSFLPQLSVIEAPYLWRDAAHMAKVAKAPVFAQMNAEFEKKRGMRMVAVTYYGKRHLTTGSKPVKSAADVVGLKLRVPPVDTFRAMVEAWGAQGDAGQLQRALSGPEPGRGRRPGKPAADDPQRQAVRGAEASHPDRPHHHAAPRHREQRFLEGAEGGRPRPCWRRAIANGVVWQDAELSAQEGSLVATLEGRRHDRDRARSRELQQAGAGDAAEAVREQMGQGHLGRAGGAVRARFRAASNAANRHPGGRGQGEGSARRPVAVTSPLPP